MSMLRGTLVVLLVAFGPVPVAAGAEETRPRAQQWGLERVRAPEAWQESRGEGIVVAVVDTGVDATHPDLAPRMLRDGDGRVIGRDEVDRDGDATDGNGHGTHVAGVVAAAADAGLRGQGIAGVAPRARLMPVRVLDDAGRGSMANLDRGIRWAVDNGADVVNLSLESAVPLPGELVASGPDDAVRYAWERGVPVVAAAGNSGTPFTDYRSSTPVLLVGATDRNDRRAMFSDAGRTDMVFAPGVDIISSACDPCGDRSGHGYESKSGTSFAAPHAAGALALLLAQGASGEEAVQRLRATAGDLAGGGMGASTGHGIIDAVAAVAARDDGVRERRTDRESDTGADAVETDTGDRPAGDEGAQQPGEETSGEDDDRASGDGDGQPGRTDDTGPSDDGQPPGDDDGQDPADDGAEGDDAPDRDERADRENGADRDGAPDQVDAVGLPQRFGGLVSRVGLLEGFAGAMVLGSAAAVAGVRRRFGGF